jgi:hypothetical protein
MPRRLPRCSPLIAALLTLLAVFGSGATAEAAIVLDGNCKQAQLPRDDDEWTAAIPLGFKIGLGAGFYEKTYINTNGMLTFGGTPTGAWYRDFVPSTTRRPMIAAFLTDIDTRNLDSDVITYGQTTYNGRPAFCVNWGNANGVGYFDQKVDLLNKFQLILVSRPDTGVGDFDIILNYGQIHFDDETLNISIPVHIGYSTGVPPGVNAVPGAGVKPSLLRDGELNSVTMSSQNSVMLGRYVFELRGGIPPAVAVVTGNVVGPFNNALAGAAVYLCSSLDPNRCYFATTGQSGEYRITIPVAELEGAAYNLGAQAPANTAWIAPSTPVQVHPVANNAVIAPFLRFSVAQLADSTVDISPIQALTADGSPMVYWHSPLTFAIDKCPNGTTSIDITQGTDGNGPSLIGGWQPMTEKPAGSGHYAYQRNPLHPNHGWTTVAFKVQCPNAPEETLFHNLYIDPSGNVLNANGNRILGALVTLFRSDSPWGPFERVPDGSAIMSPTNRQNPMYSDETGHFGWDTVPGYYVVRAEKPGCTAVGNTAQPYVETDVLPVPPPVMDLRLELDCSAVPSPFISAPSALQLEAGSQAGSLVTYEAFATDATDVLVPVTCLPASGTLFPVGTTTVTCTAMNSYGNEATVSFPVTVADTTPPVLTLPGNLAAHATSAGGTSVSYAAGAVDGIDGTRTPVCLPASGSTFLPGVTPVHCTATDAHGNVASGTFQVEVTFEFGGVLAPLSGLETSAFKRNQVIPVRFALTGASASVSTLAPRLFIAAVVGGVVGPEQPATSAGRGGNVFEPHGPLAVYQLNMKTGQLAAGTYRLRIDLGDGALHTVLITVWD